MTNKPQNEASLNRRRMLQGLGAAGIAGIAGCSSSGNSDNGGDGGGNSGGNNETSKLRMALVKSPLEFDPLVLNDVPSDEVAQNIFESLYEYDKATNPVPSLAKGDPEVSKGGKRYVVKMTGDATFQNGDSVTAEDVKYSFEVPVKEETENASDVNMIDSISVVDDTTVQFDLKYPYGAFPITLAGIAIVPKKVREKDKKAFNTKKPIGSGPFKFVDWKEGEYVDLKRNKDYWGDLTPKVDEVRFVPVEESTTRVTTLRNGKNDIIQEIPPKQYPTVKSMNDVGIDEVAGIGYFYLAFNCKEGPTTDPKVREAVDYCFDMDQAVKNYVEPTGVRQYSPLPKVLAEEWEMPLDKWKNIPHSPNTEKAKKLFDEAGISKDYKWKIIVPPDNKREQIGVTVSNGLKEAGFSNVSVQRLEWGAFLDKYNTGSESDYNMYTLGWSGSPDPDAFTYYMFGNTEDTLGVTDGTYYAKSSDRGKKATNKFIEARRSSDHAERKKLYQEGITMTLEDRVHLPSYNLKNSFGVKNYVKDFDAHPVDSFHITSGHNNVSIEK